MNALRRFILGVTLLLGISFAHALEVVPYTPEALVAAQKAGKPVALQFHANWCSSCRAQDAAFNSFKDDASLPITLFVADYDNVRDLRMQLRVASQSTVIVYRGTKQTARVAFETNPERLRTALKSAL